MSSKKKVEHGRDEMNLCEFPFATVSDRASANQVLHFEYEDFDESMQQTVTRKLMVTGDPQHGIPTAKDEEIYLALMKLTHDKNRCKDPLVKFLRPEAFELLGWKKTDWAYARLAKGMYRLTGVRMEYENLWRDNRAKQYRSKGAFGILDSFHFVDSRSTRIKSPYTAFQSSFRWSSVMFDSFESGYLKRIDYRLVRSLGVFARRLYRYLDKHFFPPNRTQLTLDVGRLAYQHIGVSPGVELDKVRKRHLLPAIEELIHADYLLKIPDEEQLGRIGQGRWEVTLRMNVGRRVNAVPNYESKLLRALVDRGITVEASLRFTRLHESKIVINAIKAMDEQRRNGIEIKDKDRWFQAALRKKYLPNDQQPGSKRPDRRVFRASTKNAQ